MSRRGLLLLWGAFALAAWWLPGWLPVTGNDREAFPAQSPRRIRYEIEAALDAAHHVIEATGELTWRNDTTVPAKEVYLHLYLNAFRDEHSTFLREASGRRRERFEEENAGGIVIERLAREGRDLLKRATFFAVEGSPRDRTVMRVRLEKPIPPGAEATFSLAWSSALPKVVARSGWGGPFHMAVQWYPKLGVFEPAHGGGKPAWNCHEYHARSEFYADYGVYHVSLRVPAAYAGRVGATGVCRDPEGLRGEDGSVTYLYDAEDVHDFAWVCDDDFVVKEYDFEDPDEPVHPARAQMTRVLGYDPGRLPPVTVRLLLQPEHEHLAARFRDAAFHALAYMGHWFGPYPYPVLTVVDPDHRARGAGGMEYPTLITTGAGYVVDADGWSPEFVTVHEFGHQHFYGLLGSNEFENAWIDEGFTTWATARVMARAYGPRPRTTRYADLPVPGERPLPFAGFLPASKRALPYVVEWLANEERLPLVGSAWPEAGEATPLSFLREVPPLTLVRVRPIGVVEHERTRIAESDLVDPVVGRFAWHHLPDSSSYGLNSYRRTAAALRTLERYLGENRVLRWVRHLAAGHRFGHPTPDDLFAAWREVHGEDLRPRLGSLFDSVGHLDYAVGAIREVGEGDDLEQEVILRRYGIATAFPVDVIVRFEDGTSRRFLWHPDDRVTPVDGGREVASRAPPARRNAAGGGTPFQGRWRSLLFGPRSGDASRVVAAEVDPQSRFTQERDRSNDGIRAEIAARPSLGIALRLLAWVEMNHAFYGGL